MQAVVFSNQFLNKRGGAKMGFTSYKPHFKKQKPVYTGHICPWCQSKSKALFLIPKGSYLDPRIGKMGACSNKDCLNSPSYHDAHPDPPFSKKELRSCKKEVVGGMTFYTMKLDPYLLQKRIKNLKEDRLIKLGHDDYLLACPVCKKWKMEILDDSAPGSFYAKCTKCNFKAYIAQM